MTISLAPVTPFSGCSLLCIPQLHQMMHMRIKILYELTFNHTCPNFGRQYFKVLCHLHHAIFVILSAAFCCTLAATFFYNVRRIVLSQQVAWNAAR